MNHIDVESFSVLDVRKVGAWRYWEHPSTEVLCLCYAVDDGPVHKWRRGDPIPEQLANAIERGALCGAHNAQFERLAFIHDLGPRLGWPVPRLEQWRCTAAQAAALALPRALDKALGALGSAVRKDPRGTSLITRFCKPRKPTKADPTTRIYPWEDPEEFDALVEYCAQDVRGERELYTVLPKLPEAEELVWRLDTTINERGLPIDIDLVDTMISLADRRAYELEQQVLALTGGLRPTQRDKILAWMRSAGADDIETLQAKELKDALADADSLPPAVQTLIAMRLEASKVSTKKLLTAKKCLSPDNRLRGSLLYHGATTGRWAGKLLQPHNFPRGAYSTKDQAAVLEYVRTSNTDAIDLLYPEPLVEAISYVLRGIIAAPEGRQLCVADYSAIEARSLVWEAGQADAVERYRQGVDQYRIMASAIFQLDIALINSAQRKVGKDVILGCGYGMGVDKFILTCEQRGAPVSREIATCGVYGYRELMPAVPKLWKAVENAAIAAVINPGKCYRAGHCKFYQQGRFLFVQLPSGRRLAYPDPEVHVVEKYGDFRNELTFMGEGKNHQWIRQSTYGGKEVENIIQAFARDLLVAGMFQAEAAGYAVISTVHDEVVSETDIGKGDVKEYERLLCTLRPWAKGCPIAAEGYIAQRWRKG